MQPMDICPLWQESRCLWVSGLVEALAGNPVQPGRRHALSCRGERRQLPHETLSSPSPSQHSAIAPLSAEDQCPGAAGTTTTDWGADNSSSFSHGSGGWWSEMRCGQALADAPSCLSARGACWPSRYASACVHTAFASFRVVFRPCAQLGLSPWPNFPFLKGRQPSGARAALMPSF